MMQTTLLLLLFLAAFCYGVAIPQSIVTGATVSAPAETFTFIIPCYSGQTGCAPRTVTLVGRDPEPEPQTLGSVSRSASIPPTLPAPISSTKSHHHPGRQTLVGSPSRSVPVWPFSTVTVVTTVTVTATPSSPTSTPPSTTFKTSSYSSSTTPIIKTLPPTTTPASTTSSDDSIRSINTDQGSSSTYSINTADQSGVLTLRQILGSPTRSVLEWPWPTVITKTITKTVTVVPPPTSVVSVDTSSQPTTTSSDDGSLPSDTSATLPVLTAPVDKNKRQILGKPTRSVSWY